MMSVDRPKNVLLVEPDFSSKYPSVPLLKFSTYLNKQKHKTRYVIGNRYIDEKVDEILITTLFTTDWFTCVNTINFYRTQYPAASIKVGGIYASLLPDHVFDNTGIKPHIGCIKEIDECPPNYALLPRKCFNETSHIITSRGCIHNCDFCSTKTIEPEKRIIRSWKNHFLPNGKHAVIHDNNIHVAGKAHFEDLVDFFKTKKIRYFLSNGFDCRLFTMSDAKLLANSPITEIRFAFDSMDQDGYIQTALRKCIKAGIRPYRIKVFILYNFKESLDDALYRAKEIRKFKINPFPMRYRPMDWLDNKSYYIDKNWSRDDVICFSSYLSKYWLMEKYSYEEWKTKRKEISQKKYRINKESGKTKMTKPAKPSSIVEIVDNYLYDGDVTDDESLFNDREFLLNYMKGLI